MNPYLLSVAGLSLDIIGVILLFKFGLPSKIIDGYAIGETLKGKDKSEQDKKNWKIRFGARWGLALLILGFILQLFSSIKQYCQF